MQQVCVCVGGVKEITQNYIQYAGNFCVILFLRNLQILKFRKILLTQKIILVIIDGWGQLGDTCALLVYTW